MADDTGVCDLDPPPFAAAVAASSSADTTMNRLHRVGLTGIVRSTVNIRPVALFLTITTSLVSPNDPLKELDSGPWPRVGVLLRLCRCR